jgi:adenine deaminase
MKGKKVDLILHNATILSLSDSNIKGEAIAIKNGNIVEIGPERQILNKYRSDEARDIEGKEIIPNLINCALQFDSSLTETKLLDFETFFLQQGITTIHVMNVSEKQLKLFEKNRKSLLIHWYLNLIPSKANIQYIRNHKKNKQPIFIQGFTLSELNKNEAKEVIAIAKSKNLQIGVDCSEGKEILDIISKSLYEYKLDHRWFAFNVGSDNELQNRLLVNNFFISYTKKEKINSTMYLIGSLNPNENLLNQAVDISTFNKSQLNTTLKSITNWASYFSFSEKKTGTLEPGKAADFTILNTPIHSHSSNQQVYSFETYRKGKLIYSME